MDEFVMVPYLMPWEPHPCLGYGMRTFDPFHSQTEAQKAYLYVVATKRYASASSEELRGFALDSSRKDKLAERLTYVITAATTALEAMRHGVKCRSVSIISARKKGGFEEAATWTNTPPARSPTRRRGRQSGM